MEELRVSLENRAGRNMAGTLHIPDGEGPFPGALVVHGFRGNRNEPHITAVTDALAWAGLVALRIDLTNNLGESDGSFHDLTVDQEVRDAQDALGRLAVHASVDGSRLGITGHSLGGLVAALAAAGDDRVKAVVTLSAVFDMAPRLQTLFGPDKIARWKEQGEMEMDPPGSGLMLGYQFYQSLLALDVPATAGRLQAPLRIVHGEADTSVPVSDARLFEQHAGSAVKEVVLIDGADHGYSRQADLMKVCLYTADWFRQHLLV